MAIGTTAALVMGGAAVAGAGISAYSSSRAARRQSSAALRSGAMQYEAAIEASKISAEAQKEAARIQAAAADRATGELRRQYDITAEQLAPWREAGTEALGTLIDMIETGPGEFEASPGYQFRLAEGAKAIEQSAAARGKQLSGGTLKALSEFGQNIASAEYDNFLNRYYRSLLPYQDLSGAGLSAAARTGEVGSATASGIANIETGTASAISQGLLASAAQRGGYLMHGAAGRASALQNAAQARASGYINQANTVGDTLSTLAMLYALK